MNNAHTKRKIHLELQEILNSLECKLNNNEVPLQSFPLSFKDYIQWS